MRTALARPGPVADHPVTVRTTAHRDISGHRWPRTAVTPIVVLGGFLGLAAALLHGAWAHPGSRIAGSCCDSLVHVSYLMSTGTALLHGGQPFFTRYLNAPAGVNAMWQPSSSLALGVLAIPVEALVGPVATYDVFATLALALSAWSAYLVLRRWVGGEAGPVVGGLVYGFSSYMVVQTVAGHIDLTSTALIPPILSVTVRLAVDRDAPALRLGAALGGLLVLQLLVDQELLADTVLACGVVLGTLALLYRTRVTGALRRLVHGGSAALGAFLVLAAWPLSVAFFGPGRPSSPILQPAVSPDLFSFLAPTPLINVDPQWVRTLDAAWFPDQVDQSSAYLGIGLVVFTLVAVVALRRRPAVKVAGIAGAVMALLSLGPRLRLAGHLTPVPLPWAVLAHLPLVRYAVTGRLVLFTWLAVALIAAVVVRAATSDHLPGRTAWLAGLAAGIVLVIPSASFPTYTEPTPAFFTDASLSAVVPEGSVAYVAPFPRDFGTNVATMLWQAETRMRFSMPGGYVLVPDGTGRLIQTSAPIDGLSRALLTIEAGGPTPPPSSWGGLAHTLTADHAAAVIVGPMDHEGAAVAFFRDLLHRPPRRTGGVDFWLLRH